MIRANSSFEKKELNYFEFICRGCTMRGRERIWSGYLSSIASEFNRQIDNSYLTLVEEPSNSYDPNAVMVVCRGEFFGTVGYVGKEFTHDVKEILKKCNSYRVDMFDETNGIQSQILLLITWN